MVLILAMLTAGEERKERVKGGEGRRREEKGKEVGVTQEQGGKVNTHAIACAMTESCEWRGQTGFA